VTLVSGLVSVIIPVFNRPELVRSAVESALAQTYPLVEVIVVDDGSTDETPQVLEALCQQHPEKVRVLRTANRGPGLAREAGRQAAKGEFVQYLDSDDLLCKTKLARQVDALRRYPDSRFSLCGTAVVDAHGALLDSGLPTNRGSGTLFPELLNSRWWQTSTPLYRRQLLVEAGPWPTDRLFEDWQYEAQIGVLGARYCYVPHVLTMFRRHEDHRLRDAVRERGTRVASFAVAVERVYRCAKRAGVSSSDPEMLRFVHQLLHTAGECSDTGQPATARRLLAAATKESLLSGRAGMIALCIKRGWRVLLRDRRGGGS